MAIGDTIDIIANSEGIAVPKPASGAPDSSVNTRAGVARIYAVWRNGGKMDRINQEKSFYDDDGSTVITKKSVTDNGTIYDEGAAGAP